MVTVAFRDAAGRPLVGAVISIAAAPGEFTDIAMIADDRGEIRITPSGFGDHEFSVFHDGGAHAVVARIGADTKTLVLQV